MLLEEIFLHSLRIIVVITFFVISYLVWKYLNKKALGMQTILDQMVKDLIRFHILVFFFSWLVYVKFQETYSHYVALSAVMTTYFVTFVCFWQILVTTIIR